MANPLRNILSKTAVIKFPAHTRWILAGLAHDFWKDGPENPLRRFYPARDKATSSKIPLRPVTETGRTSQAKWHAQPGELSEKMWGEGFVAPGDDAVTDMLIKPLGLTKDMSVLDLSAGLGGRMRKATAEFGVYITGLEPDPGIAARGMQMSMKAGKGKYDAITHYVPAEFTPSQTVTRNYDCVIARETFYLVQDKHKFFTALAVSTKPQAQISFTDYIVNPEDQDKPAVTAWKTYEGDATPLGLIEMAEAWAKAGFKLRVHDDQSPFYRKEALAGLQKFARFLSSGVQPDEETRKAILRRMELWAHRLTAMEHGMKFYRFYGTK